MTVHHFPGSLLVLRVGKQTRHVSAFSTMGDCSLRRAMSVSRAIKGKMKQWRTVYTTVIERLAVVIVVHKTGGYLLANFTASS